MRALQIHHSAVARQRVSNPVDPINPGLTNLLAWWALDDAASPGTWQDAHTGNYDLTKTGGVTSGTGVVGGDADFNGSTGYLENASISAFHASSFTMGMWVNFDTFGTSVVLGGRCGNSSGTYQCYFQRTAGNLITCVLQATGYFVASSNTTYASTGWHFVAVTRSGNTLTLYIDGAAQTDVETISGTEQTEAQAFRLGEGATTFLDGKLDEAFIYTAALTAGNIDYLYNGGAGRTYAEVAA